MALIDDAPELSYCAELDDPAPVEELTPAKTEFDKKKAEIASEPPMVTYQFFDGFVKISLEKGYPGKCGSTYAVVFNSTVIEFFFQFDLTRDVYDLAEIMTSINGAIEERYTKDSTQCYMEFQRGSVTIN